MNKIMFSTWFDVNNIKHVFAYYMLEEQGSWPENFIPEHVWMDDDWQSIVNIKFVDAWTDLMFQKEHVYTKDMIKSEVKKIISENLDINIDSINSNHYFFKDLEVESYEKEELLLEIEVYFNVKFPNGLKDSLKKVQDVIDFIDFSKKNNIF